MAINKLSKEAEQRLVDSLEKVSDLVSEGESPNEAIAKVASAASIPAGHINLMVSSFNTGRTEAHRKTANDVFEKAAEFELADTDTILKKMFPEEVKTAAQKFMETAVSEQYSTPPNWYSRIKKASVVLPELPPMETRKGNGVTKQAEYPIDPMDVMKKSVHKYESFNNQVEEKRAALANTQDRLFDSIHKLANYFRKPGCEPYVGVKNNMIRMYGKQAEALFEMVEKRNTLITKQAAAFKEIYSPVNLSIEPYSLVKDCLEKAATLIDKKNEYDTILSKKAEVAELQLRPFCQLKEASQTGGVLESFDKESSLGSTGASAYLGYQTGKNQAISNIGDGLAQSVFGTLPKDKLLNKAINELNDPLHIAKMRNIQSSATLTDLMANDQVISAFDPEEIFHHYNEISQLAPRAAANEGFMRAFLRKRLEGGKSAIDPFDIQQILDIENKVKKRDAESSGMGDLEL
jgi:uncharacterized protein YoaH (UPF0181 family)